MQHTNHSGFATQEAFIAGQKLHTFAGHPEQAVIEDFLIASGQASELFRNGKGKQKIFNGQQHILLPVNPVLGFIVLTLRAVTVSAGIIQIMHFITLLAVVFVPS
jgi:hypothetical protein